VVCGGGGASSPAPAAADLGRWCAVEVACGGGWWPLRFPPLSVCGMRGWWRGGTAAAAWWRGGVCAAAASSGGCGAPCTFFYFKIHLRRELKVPLGAYPPRGSTHALGEGSFAGTVSAERPSPRANSR
jgi:hypothetical protein